MEMTKSNHDQVIKHLGPSHRADAAEVLSFAGYTLTVVLDLVTKKLVALSSTARTHRARAGRTSSEFAGERNHDHVVAALALRRSRALLCQRWRRST
jgi:hypothetical protein